MPAKSASPPRLIATVSGIEASLSTSAAPSPPARRRCRRRRRRRSPGEQHHQGQRDQQPPVLPVGAPDVAQHRPDPELGDRRLAHRSCRRSAKGVARHVDPALAHGAVCFLAGVRRIGEAECRGARDQRGDHRVEAVVVRARALPLLGVEREAAERLLELVEQGRQPPGAGAALVAGGVDAPGRERGGGIDLDHLARARAVHRRAVGGEPIEQAGAAHRDHADQVGRDAERPAHPAFDQRRSVCAEGEPEAVGVLVLAAARPARAVAMGDDRLDELVRPAERRVDPDLVGLGDQLEQLLVGEPGVEVGRWWRPRAPTRSCRRPVPPWLRREIDPERPHGAMLWLELASPSDRASAPALKSRPRRPLRWRCRRQRQLRSGAPLANDRDDLGRPRASSETLRARSRSRTADQAVELRRRRRRSRSPRRSPGRSRRSSPAACAQWLRAAPDGQPSAGSRDTCRAHGAPEARADERHEPDIRPPAACSCAATATATTGGGDPPPQVHGLVPAQGQAREGRGLEGGRAARGRGGDRLSLRGAGASCPRSPISTARPAASSSATG